MQLSVLGSSLLGTVTATGLAHLGHDVLLYAESTVRAAALRSGDAAGSEPELGRALVNLIDAGQIRIETDLPRTVLHCSLIFLAPPCETADDSLHQRVARVLASDGTHRTLVNLETAPIGATDALDTTLRHAGLVTGFDYDLVALPHFFSEGSALAGFLHPDRVVIGTASVPAARQMTRLFAPLAAQGCPLVVMSPRAAELTKSAANAFLAMKISFMNEVAALCQRLGADVEDVRLGLGPDPRIGRSYLRPGIGFGGAGLARDLTSLIDTAHAHHLQFDVLEPVLEVNRQQPQRFLARLRRLLGTFEGKHIAVWGLAYKPDTADVCDAPAHAVVRCLLAEGASVSAYDPEATSATYAIFGEDIAYAETPYHALRDADALIVCTEWPHFRRLDVARMHALMRRPVLLDGRNLYDPRRMADQGFTYLSVGRPTLRPMDRLVAGKGVAGVA
ncbi:MAG: nucleotide sugar dehydrogenase [Bacteroidota bacterium]